MKLGKFGKIVVVVLIGTMTIVGLSGLIFLIPNASSPKQPQQKTDTTKNVLTHPTMNKVNITTTDKIKIVGNYYQPAGEVKGFVLYVHMMPATKDSYDELATRLQRVGYAGLSIDLRGHGESEGGPKGYMSYTAEETQASIKDVEASIEFLKKHGAVDENISIVGASIGANLAIEYASQNKSINRVIALSPGLNYYGIKADEFIKEFSQNQSLLLVGSKNDPNVPGDYEQVLKLEKDFPFKNMLDVKTYTTKSHGTDIIKDNPSLEDEIVAFIVR